jgi:hypothetical protein
MGTARITNQQARQAIELAGLRASVREDEFAGLTCPDGYTEAEIDRLLEDVDRELAAQERTEKVQLAHRFTDQVRARRMHRRADREVLRALPVRIEVPPELGSEAA